jgi:hypothetical protein
LFDFDLHFRFLRKATEVFFEMSQASVAAAVAWQSRLHDEMTPGGRQTASAPAFWPMWFGDWTPGTATPAGRFTDPFEAFRAAATNPSPFGNFTPFGHMAAATSPSAAFDPMQTWMAAASAWQDLAQHGAMAACGAGLSAWPNSAMPSAWNVTPWNIYQAPMMAMMLSYGVPYSVAAPTARASTSAMDAAEAAYTQLQLVFGTPTKTNARPPAMPPWQAYPL